MQCIFIIHLCCVPRTIVPTKLMLWWCGKRQLQWHDVSNIRTRKKNCCLMIAMIIHQNVCSIQAFRHVYVNHNWVLFLLHLISLSLDSHSIDIIHTLMRFMNSYFSWQFIFHFSMNSIVVHRFLHCSFFLLSFIAWQYVQTVNGLI